MDIFICGKIYKIPEEKENEWKFASKLTSSDTLQIIRMKWGAKVPHENVLIVSAKTMEYAWVGVDKLREIGVETETLYMGVPRQNMFQSKFDCLPIVEFVPGVSNTLSDENIFMIGCGCQEYSPSLLVSNKPNICKKPIETIKKEFAEYNGCIYCSSIDALLFVNFNSGINRLISISYFQEYSRDDIISLFECHKYPVIKDVFSKVASCDIRFIYPLLKKQTDSVQRVLTAVRNNVLYICIVPAQIVNSRITKEEYSIALYEEQLKKLDSLSIVVADAGFVMDSAYYLISSEKSSCIIGLDNTNWKIIPVKRLLSKYKFPSFSSISSLFPITRIVPIVENKQENISSIVFASHDELVNRKLRIHYEHSGLEWSIIGTKLFIVKPHD